MYGETRMTSKRCCPFYMHFINHICDVISEKGPYCGRNRVFLDQLFLHFCDSIFYQNFAGSEKNVSFRYSLASNIIGPDQTPRIMRGVWSRSMIFDPQ